uniref:Carbohydrate kinase PfkB domain-containing protein n=1 Tax=Aegilops tauschii TaxID=37682 RepID=M8BBN3_AEGTA
MADNRPGYAEHYRNNKHGGVTNPAALPTSPPSKPAGILCSYDPNVRLPLWPSTQAARDGIVSIWKEADFIKVSDEEVPFLTRGDTHDEKTVLSLWFDEHKKGCRYFTKDFEGSLPGYSINTVDTTDAGDSYVGSLLLSAAKDDSG